VQLKRRPRDILRLSHRHKISQVTQFHVVETSIPFSYA
jgi:hypothetical protein